jgi:acetylornithine deacetylase/succinyl-diaminopimelate desuccinylase-like protein
VADEENLGPDGMEYLRKSGKVRPDALILGAQTENNLIVAERGVMWAEITTKGQGRPCRQPGGRRQRHPAHDAARRRPHLLLRQGAGQAGPRAR